MPHVGFAALAALFAVVGLVIPSAVGKGAISGSAPHRLGLIATASLLLCHSELSKLDEILAGYVPVPEHTPASVTRWVARHR